MLTNLQIQTGNSIEMYSLFHIAFICLVFFSPTAPEASPIIVSSAFASNSNETRKVRPDVPEVEITVDMVVLARRRAMRWQRGKITEIINKGKEEQLHTFNESNCVVS